MRCLIVSIPDLCHLSYFFNQRVGQKKKQGKMMRIMQTEGKLNPAKRIINHSARKHTVQKLRDSDVAPTIIRQISGHKKTYNLL